MFSHKWDIYIIPPRQCLGTIWDIIEGLYEPEPEEKHSEKVSGHNSASEIMNLYQVWTPTLELHMMQTVNNSAWGGRSLRVQSPYLAEELLTFDLLLGVSISFL